MEIDKGDISFKINFPQSDNNLDDILQNRKNGLVGVFDDGLRIDDSGALAVSMALAFRYGDIRSHGNLIEKVYGIGENKAEVSLSELLGTTEEVKMDCRLWVDYMTRGGITAADKKIMFCISDPDTLDLRQRREVAKIAVSIGAAAIRCSELSPEDLKKSPTKLFSADDLSDLGVSFRYNMHFDKKWQKYIT